MPESHCLISAALEPQVHPLAPDRGYVLGRDSAADIKLVSDRVSHQHARLVWSGAQFVLEDLGSKNGVSVEGARTGRHSLVDGELISVGPFNLRYRVLTGDVSGLLAGAVGAVSGRFSEGELIDLASMIQIRQLTGTLQIELADVRGALAISKGVVVRAEAGPEKGLVAAQLLLSANEGRFEFRAAAQVEKGELAAPLADLLIDLMASRRRATKTVESPGDVSGDLTGLRGRLQAARADLELAKTRGEFGNLFGALLIGFFAYSISLTLLQRAPFYKNVVNPIATAIFAGLIIRELSRSSYPLKTFGITMENWRRALVESLLVTAPVLLILVLGRLALRESLDPNRELAIFHLDARFLAYPIIVPLQEVVLRGAVQTSLQRFLIGKGAAARAVVLSSLMFGMVHLHISITMTICTFVASLVWGALYVRHRTLFGVCVSHLLLGMVGYAFWGGVIPGIWD